MDIIITDTVIMNIFTITDIPAVSITTTITAISHKAITNMTFSMYTKALLMGQIGGD